MLPVVCPFLTGNAPVLLTGAVTVSLFAALGCLPPPLMQAYRADAVALRVIDSVVTVVPSPASLKVATRLPELLTLALALMKCGLLADAWLVSFQNTMQTLSKSAHMHTTGYFNMEALQATKVLAHYENMFEKHALPNANTTTRRRALEEVVQNRHREKYLE